MFRVDPNLTDSLSQVPGSSLRKYAFTSSTSQEIARDLVFSWYAFGRPSDHPSHPGYVLPYVTRVLESSRFSPLSYASCLRPVPTAKVIYNALRNPFRPVGPGPNTAAAAAL
jgi:hypothetical protein